MFTHNEYLAIEQDEGEPQEHHITILRGKHGGVPTREGNFSTSLVIPRRRPAHLYRGVGVGQFRQRAAGVRDNLEVVGYQQRRAQGAAKRGHQTLDQRPAEEEARVLVFRFVEPADGTEQDRCGGLIIPHWRQQSRPKIAGHIYRAHDI